MGNLLPKRKPRWLRKKLVPSLSKGLKKSLRGKGLNTVCESASCPNISECFADKTATIMILGTLCTRACRFCGVNIGKPEAVNLDEPFNTAIMIKELGLSHAVITSVTRDDLPDGGSTHFVKTVEAIRELNETTTIELLIPDFGGNEKSIMKVLGSRPDILNHNIETVPSLQKKIRPQADFNRSLNVLKIAVREKIPAKSGIMVGLGEHEEELLDTIKMLHDVGVEMLTIGQYLQPSRMHLPVEKYMAEEWFEKIAEKGREIGIKKVFAGSFVRSSYKAKEVMI